jgi:crotonobetainyl-CoA:carnitine CoA-transferase CaiB-like acyl-CoA transferase
MLGGLQISAVDSGGFRFTSSGGDAGISAAPMLAALTMVAALAHRDRTGKGCWLETSLVDAGVFSRHVDVFRHFNPGYQVRMPVIENAAPKYNVYRCSDGKFVMFMPAERKFWQRFCAAVQRPEWADRGTWASQMDYGIGDDELARGLETLFHTKTQREWVMWLGPLGIPICPAGPLDELLDDDEFIAARALVARYHEDRLDDDIALAAFPVKRSGVPFRVERPAPDVGQHNDEILGELGYDGAAIAAMYASGAVFRPSR